MFFHSLKRSVMYVFMRVFSFTLSHVHAAHVADRYPRLQWGGSLCGQSLKPAVDQRAEKRCRWDSNSDKLQWGLAVCDKHSKFLSFPYKKILKVTILLSFCSSQASPDSRLLTPLPRRLDNRGLAATLQALSSGTGWYQDSGTGAHPFLWCIVGLVVLWPSLRRSYLLHYQSCRLSQEKVHRRWRLLTTGSTAHAPGENSDMYHFITVSI